LAPQFSGAFLYTKFIILSIIFQESDDFMNGYYREFMPNEKEDNTQKQKTAGLPNESLENNNIRNNAINSQTNPRNVPQTNLQNNSQTNPQTNLRNVPQTNPQANPETNSQTNLQTNPQTNLRTNPQINSSINPQTVTQTSPQNDSQSIPQTISENNARTIPESIRQNNNQQTAQNNQNSNQVPTANNNNVQNNSNLQRNADSEGNYNEHLSRFNEQLGASINVNNQSNQTSNRQNYENIAESEVESLEGGENSETIRVPYTGNGKLIVQVTLARQAIPLENAKVTVNSTNGSPIEINEVRYTGQNGRTEPIDLPAPPVYYSKQPQEKVQPYAVYDVKSELDGYYTIENAKHALVFDNIASIQNIEMIPNEENRD
jgi:hypothetical protein